MSDAGHHHSKFNNHYELGTGMQGYFRTGGVLLAFLAAFPFTHSVEAAFKGNLTVQVDGIRNQRGQLCIRLFSRSQGFPEGSTSGARRQCSKITDNPMTFTFNNLPSGNYAVAVFHDSNGDGKLNRNSLGMPTEGYGFSNNPVYSRTGPPKYGEATFLLAGSNTNVRIRMRYGN
ncbi:DUF2141 domain-containing protein [Leptothermofonsia sp. ETS-13]|uniref:DUF2141 domain-containing protein n=1 Tax=Leptothermofonsia sp. ETS-13 TaxID=3035696 RepID=UPI003B9F9BFF